MTSAVAVVVLLAPAQTQLAGRAYAAPTGLPDHFSIGLAAGQDDGGISGWMPKTGIPWDYAYQYLAGGAGRGWSTWNDKGQFVLFYAKAATSHGYTPVFSYYMLLQSDGPCAQCDERQKDLAHLNDPSTMRSYFSDFGLLMKRLGSGTYDGVAGYGGPVIVHVEPDLSGYAEQAAQFEDPSTVPAAVASSGVPEVAAFPNTYQGFNFALLHLRDVYAPNVLLAFHISPWATGTDIGSSRDAGINADALGRRAGVFARDSGVAQVGGIASTYDVLFTDVLDRDAGFYKYAQNDPNRWWDRLNISYPNFARWEQFMSAAVHSAGKPAMVWQVPLGNQYFQSEDNSKGHYQDNRVEYFFGHLDELREAGIVGLLFGGGAGAQTTYNDADGDGVSNPAPLCTTDGISSGQICNDHPSSVADDDGGYLRMVAKDYYAHPLPVSGVPAAQAPPAIPTDTNASLQLDLGSSSVDPLVAAPGQDLNVVQNGISSANASVLVQLGLYAANGQAVAQAQVPNQPVMLGSVAPLSGVLTLPDTIQPGRYTLKVGVFSNDGTIRYAWNDAAGTVTVVPPSAPQTSDAEE